MKYLAWDDAMESVRYGKNKKAGHEALQEVTLLKNRFKDNTAKKNALERQQKCLENCHKLLSLEDALGNLHGEICERTVKLTEDLSKEDENLNHNLTATDYQSCMLGVKGAWKWLEKLTACSELQLKRCSDHHQFFHAAKETSEWMPVDVGKAHELLRMAEVKETSLQADVNQKLLLEIVTALSIFMSWQARVGRLLQQSRQLTPVKPKSRPTQQPFPAVSLAEYATKEATLHEGEEVLVVDNSSSQTWKVKNLNNDTYHVPSLIISPTGQDAAAIDAAMKICMRFLFLWTDVVRKYGKTIILFLLHVIRVWDANEKGMLRALKEGDKKDIRQLLTSIGTTFSPYWDAYPPYKTLLQRSQLLREILDQPPDPSYTPGENGHLLVIQTIPLEQLLSKYREFWKEWETYKVLLETTRHPQYLLCVENWEQYQFIDPSQWIKKWQTELSVDEVDYDMLGRSAVKEEEIQVERSSQTAESSRLYSSHQEENQTFVITGVTDPNSGERISLDQAVAMGIINQAEGKYVNPVTKEAVAIPVAMNAGKIIVEKVSVRKSKERVQDIGVMTITTIKENRPYVLKGVKDSNSDKILSVDEATSMGLLDQQKGTFEDRSTGQRISLADALDSGLLLVEFKGDHDSPQEPVIETKTYQINSVLNATTNQRVTFSEAVRLGLLNPSDGSYRDNQRGMDIYIGDAIKEGFVRAVVVNDPSSLDVDVSKRVLVGQDRLNHFKKTVLNPLKALRAMRK